MVPVAASYSAVPDGSSGSNRLLPFGQPSFSMSYCRDQHVTDHALVTSRLYPFYQANESGFRLHPWWDAVNEPFAVDRRLTNSKIATTAAKVSSEAAEISEQIKTEPDVVNAKPSVVQVPNNNSLLSQPVGPERQDISDNKAKTLDSDLLGPSHTFPCSLPVNLMNGAENLAMTGSSNPRTDHLSWLADVSNRGVQNATSSPSHEKGNITAPPVHRTTENLAVPLVLSNSGNLFCPSLTIASPGDLNTQRMYTPPYHTVHPSHHASSSYSGTNHTLYYSQAPRMPPYSNLYLGQYPPTTSFPPSSSPSTTEANQPIVATATARPYFTVDNFPAPISNRTAGIQSHSQLPQSPGYVQRNMMTSSPIEHASTRPSTSPQQRTILVSRSPEEPLLLSHSPHEMDKSHTAIRLSPSTSHISPDERKKPTYRSPETVTGSSTHDSGREIPSRNSHLLGYGVPKNVHLSHSSIHGSYRVPTGKEGSLKHRILRPPSISIVEPPQSVMSDAPLSAPPIRSHRDELASKRLRLETTSSYRSYSTSASTSADNPRTVVPVHSLATSQYASSSTTTHDSSSNPSPVPPSSSGSGPQLQYPACFMKGSIIQLANGQLKQVENIATEDFVECASLSSDLKIDSSTVIHIEKSPAAGSAKLGFSVGQNKVQITVEAPLEHPFFVFGQGWSSCAPERTLQRYGLTCHKLKVSDICVSLTQKESFSDGNTKTTKVASVTEGLLKPSLSVPTCSFAIGTHNQEDKSASASSFHLLRPKVTSDINEHADSLLQNSISKFGCIPEKQSVQIDGKKLSAVSMLPNLKTLPVSFLPNTAKSSALSQPEAGGKRKRRWSLPDNLTLPEVPITSSS